jgi:hypothetical protein
MDRIYYGHEHGGDSVSTESTDGDGGRSVSPEPNPAPDGGDGA